MVVGANGQDGTFLVRHLVRRGYVVMGVGRQPDSRNNSGLAGYVYRKVDLEYKEHLAQVLDEFRPDFIFHVAAVHMSAGGEYEPYINEVLLVNVGSVGAILEFLRKNPSSRLAYCSSAKVFGASPPDYICEATPKKSECIYSISKNAAFSLIEYYRANHGVNASVFWLFNHESEYRPQSFFIPKVVRALAFAINGEGYQQKVYSLGFYCDWGSAEEYMDIIVDSMEKCAGEDFIIATGRCEYAKDMISRLFSLHNLDYRKYFLEEMQNIPGSRPYQVDISKLRSRLGRIPKLETLDICKNILIRNYKLLNSNDFLLKSAHDGVI